MKMKFINVAAAVISAFALLSCNEKFADDSASTPGNQTTITLNIGAEELSRATQGQENAIKTITAYLFVANGYDWAGTWVPSTTKAVIRGSSATVTIIMNNENSIPDSQRRVDIFLVANNPPITLPTGKGAGISAFMSALTSGFDNTATGDDFKGLPAMQWAWTLSIKRGEIQTYSTPVVLGRVQARTFVSNTKALSDISNGLQGYTLSFSGLAEQAVLYQPRNPNSFTGVTFNGTYTYNIKGDNSEENFNNQEPVGYIYPSPSNKPVTVTVTDPNRNTKSTTFVPLAGKNYRINVTPGATAAELGISVELWTGNDTSEKYMVVVVAGQSNSVGYDESPINFNGVSQLEPNAFQLAYRAVAGGNLNIVPLQPSSDNLQDMLSIRPTIPGAKGIHLPLAKELLKRIPKGYKILVVPVAFGGTAFTSGVPGNYFASEMRPDFAARKWGAGTPYAKTMIDRTKYALNLNPKNKFLGVVWCQGEHDRNNSKLQYPLFDAMATEFFTAINASHASRCPKGRADKDLWYNYSTTAYWHVWNGGNNCSDIFGGYKVWNPNTFIHIPLDTPTNATNRVNPQLSSAWPSHFGDDAFSKVIAPMVVQCMDDNGGLFNGNPNIAAGRFVEKDIRAAAATLGGKFTDADIQQNLLLFMPFARTPTENSATAGGYDASGAVNASMVAENFIDVNGRGRSRNVLQILPSSTMLKISRATNVSGAWSVAFMVKRTSSLTSANYTVAEPILYGTNVNSPFFGYKTLTSGSNDEVVAGGNVEFVAQRVTSDNRALTMPGRFIDADNVRTMDQWIHYVITSNGTNRTSIYINGERIIFPQANDRTVTLTPYLQFSDSPTTDLSTLFIGKTVSHSNTLGAKLADLGIWNKELSEQTVKKLYLYSYYGYTKP